MDLVTQKEFADMNGVRAQTIATQIKRGKLRKYRGTNKISLDDTLTKIYLDARSKSKSKVSYVSDVTTLPKPDKSNRKPDNNGQNDPDNNISPDNPNEQMQKLYWDIRKQMESALKTEVERNKARGLLIKRDLVQRIFAKLYTIDSNELKPLGDKLAPDIAAIFESDDPQLILAVSKKIEKEIFRSLGHIKRLMNDFLIRIEAEKIK